MNDRADWAARYEAGESSTSIALSGGCCPDTVLKHLRKHGVKIRSLCGQEEVSDTGRLAERMAAVYPDGDPRREWVRRSMAEWAQNRRSDDHGH